MTWVDNDGWCQGRQSWCWRDIAWTEWGHVTGSRYRDWHAQRYHPDCSSSVAYPDSTDLISHFCLRPTEQRQPVHHPKTATSFSPFSHRREALSQISTSPPPPPITPPQPSPPARPETMVAASPLPGLTHNVSAGLNRLSSSATAALQYTPVHVEVGRQRR